MTALPRARSPRRGRPARSALLVPLVALLSLASLAFAPAAGAGQIVWSTGSGIWAMNDDGSDPHELIAASSSQLVATLPSGTLAEPDVFQNGGTAVLFLGLTSHFAPASLPAACGADCSGTYELSGGVLRELAPAAAAATGAAYYERQPRVTADGQELFDSTLYTGIGAGAAGTPATALVERPLAPNATITQWSSTDSELEPAAGFDGAPDPADPTMAAWVQAQGCGFTVTNAQGVSQSSCQYAVHFGSAADAAAPIATYDNELVSANGTGPTSLALSTDGTTLLLVDPYAPNEGIFTTPVAGTPGVKPVTEIVAQPAGWTFGQARFAGASIVFDAHQQVNGMTTGDIYSIAASCGMVETCTFPASAIDLTRPRWPTTPTPPGPRRRRRSRRCTSRSWLASTASRRQRRSAPVAVSRSSSGCRLLPGSLSRSRARAAARLSPRRSPRSTSPAPPEPTGSCWRCRANARWFPGPTSRPSRCAARARSRRPCISASDPEGRRRPGRPTGHRSRRVCVPSCSAGRPPVARSPLPSACSRSRRRTRAVRAWRSASARRPD
jgi:hypothetical protein